MIKKRISILSLTLLFLVSTTGLPVTYHLCEIMQKKSLSECEICLIEMKEIEESCCDYDDNSDLVTQLSAAGSSCCTKNFVYKKIDDDFSQSANTNPAANNSAFLILPPSFLSAGKTKTDPSYLSKFNLPPLKFGKQLLQSINQLKISPPVC
jgi:hypothetical protein